MMSPAAAAWYPRVNVRQGEAEVHGLASAPPGDRKTFAGPVVVGVGRLGSFVVPPGVEGVVDPPPPLPPGWVPPPGPPPGAPGSRRNMSFSQPFARRRTARRATFARVRRVRRSRP